MDKAQLITLLAATIVLAGVVALVAPQLQAPLTTPQPPHDAVETGEPEYQTMAPETMVVEAHEEEQMTAGDQEAPRSPMMYESTSGMGMDDANTPQPMGSRGMQDGMMDSGGDEHGMGPGMMGGAGMGGMMEGEVHGGGDMEFPACSGISEYTPQENIMWLLQNHWRFNWSYTEYPDNLTVRWVIVADTPDAAQRLYEHILQMECVLENGGTPRAMDPVFRLEAAVYEYIHTNVTLKEGSTVEVVKWGENTCSYEVIRLHAQVVQGFFERGMEEARQTHPVPEDVLSECSSLVGEISLDPGMDGEHDHGRGGTVGGRG